jgi:hypothetical protein
VDLDGLYRRFRHGPAAETKYPAGMPVNEALQVYDVTVVVVQGNSVNLDCKAGKHPTTIPDPRHRVIEDWCVPLSEQFCLLCVELLGREHPRVPELRKFH